MGVKDIFRDRGNYPLEEGLYLYSEGGREEYVCLTPNPSMISEEPFWWTHKVIGDGQFKITPKTAKNLKRITKQNVLDELQRLKSHTTQRLEKITEHSEIDEYSLQRFFEQASLQDFEIPPESRESLDALDRW